MQVDIIFVRTSDPCAYGVFRKCVRIGSVVYDSGIDKWIFKHFFVDHLLFVGDTREEAVSIYYIYFGGTNNGRMESCRFSEECDLQRSGR